jgi:hypothetical protein
VQRIKLSKINVEVCRPIIATSNRVSIYSKVLTNIAAQKNEVPFILKWLPPPLHIASGAPGGIPRSSSTIALIIMLHNWAKATDGTGNSVRVLLVVYRKAFDLIDHSINKGECRSRPISAFVYIFANQNA